MHNVKEDTELYIIAPDEQGASVRVLGTLANAGINLKALCTFKEKDSQVFMVLTSNNKKAIKSLKALGYIVKSRSVVTALIDDRIGAAAEIVALLGNAAIDIRFCYGSSIGEVKTLLVLHTSNNKKAVETLK